MNDYGYVHKPRSRRRKKHRRQRIIQTVLLIVLIGVGLVSAIWAAGRLVHPRKTPVAAATKGGSTPAPEPSANEPAGGETTGEETESTTQGEDTRLKELLAQADYLAAGYDYEKAIELLTQNEEYNTREEVLAAVKDYEEQKTLLVEADRSKITHVFFHSLIMDTSKAFDGDNREAGYNQVMTTADEFKKIIQIMYDKGYVLVRLHDIAYEETQADGTVKMVPGHIMLPEGKIPFVMSQDDLCYYEYMEGDGFARRIVIGEDGMPVCEMVMDDGTISTGAYDLVPILEEFIQEHPDFSYHGARAVLAFTGYQGVLGYRTAFSYRDTNANYEADREEAAKVAQCLRDKGWELASHSWGHRYLGQISYEHFKEDTDKWEAEVETIIGPTDIILYPFGDDIGDWKPYKADNERYNYLRAQGFRYFCNVDSNEYWVQLQDGYLRQGRRNLDGYRMYYDMDIPATGQVGAGRLKDLFDAKDVFDSSRPTPVPPMGS